MINIYIITNKINNKQYVGKTKFSLQKRFEEHCKSNSNMYIHNAINTYGKDNFTIELICRCKDNEWKDLEKFYIEKYQTHYTKGGYNITLGGDSNPMDEEVAREHHRIKCTTAEFIEEHRIKSLGKKHSEESKKKMSIIQKELYKDNDELKNRIKMNQPKRVAVKMLDENENVIKEFNSLCEVCRYFNKSGGSTPTLHKVIDKYNKNGKRAKFWGYYWTKL